MVYEPLTPLWPRSRGLARGSDPMRWFTRLVRRALPDDEPELDAPTLADLQRARLEAERKLTETRRAGREISFLADTARRLRTRDNFSERMDHLFGRDG